MKKTILTLTGIYIFLSVLPQAPLGTWTSYLPYNKAFSLAITEHRIFCSTHGGMFYYDDQDHSIQKFSKEDGLSDFEISTLAYSEETGNLIIAYTNANIDLVKGNQIYNIPDIKRKQIIGDKNIYDIHFIGTDAYLACGFGIVRLDLTKREIRETYLIGDQGMQLKINALTNYGNDIFAATDEGLYSANLEDQNLIDYNNWHKINSLPSSGFRCTALASTDNLVYVNLLSSQGDLDQVYVLRDDAWELFQDYASTIVNNLSAEGKNLVVCAGQTVQVISETGGLVREAETGHPAYARLTADNTLWVADDGRGLIRSRTGEELFTVYPNGPFDLNIVALADAGGKLLGVGGGYTSGLNNQFRPAYIYRYENQSWNNWVSGEYRDPVAIAMDSENTSHYYIGTWGYGLLEFMDNKFLKAYDVDNSSLQSIIPGGKFIRIGGLAFDSHKNLWVPNSGVNSPLSVLKPDGTWQSFAIGTVLNAPNIGKIIVTRDDLIWMLLPGGNGIFVYDYNGTIDNTDDDRFRKLTVVDVNNKLITNDVQSIAEDHQGSIWLGTNAGILIYDSPSRIFGDDLFYARPVKVPRNDGTLNADLLLSTETVTDIEVDGANRKWLGTKSGGVFLVSDDGLTQIHSFNTDNSPLLSNSITDIAIDDKNGEVFFGTFNGIISYVGDATGPDAAFNDVYVFPNPVRPEYHGDIVINGLVENTYLKITDLNGNLVYEAISMGGRAVWNGNNLNGDRVSTGVYLVFCTNEDGSLTHVTKLLFIH